MKILTIAIPSYNSMDYMRNCIESLLPGGEDVEILIVDEALSVGDKEFRKKCKKKINDIVKEENVTFLFVTHSTEVARDFCKRGIVMKKGKLVYDGNIDNAIEFYEKLLASSN